MPLHGCLHSITYLNYEVTANSKIYRKVRGIDFLYPSENVREMHQIASWFKFNDWLCKIVSNKVRKDLSFSSEVQTISKPKVLPLHFSSRSRTLFGVQILILSMKCRVEFIVKTDEAYLESIKIFVVYILQICVQHYLS